MRQTLLYQQFRFQHFQLPEASWGLDAEDPPENPGKFSRSPPLRHSAASSETRHLPSQAFHRRMSAPEEVG